MKTSAVFWAFFLKIFQHSSGIHGIFVCARLISRNAGRYKSGEKVELDN